MKKIIIPIFVLLFILIITFYFNKSGFKKEETNKEISQKIIVESVFKEGEMIPAKYTCDGFNTNPPLTLKNLPRETKSLVIIVEDVDAPQGIFTHWLAWNIEPTENLPEEYQPPNEGLNDFGKINYGGPCPPPNSKPHRYFFKVLAINSLLNFPNGTKKEEILSSLKGKILAEGEIMGLYQR